VQSPIETALAQHRGNHAIGLQRFARRLEVPTEEHDGRDGSGHHFGIAHRALDIFRMMQPVEQVVTQAINRYNTVVHGFLQGLGFGHH
jgi:hypothetical protein